MVEPRPHRKSRGDNGVGRIQIFRLTDVEPPRRWSASGVLSGNWESHWDVPDPPRSETCRGSRWLDSLHFGPLPSGFHPGD